VSRLSRHTSWLWIAGALAVVAAISFVTSAPPQSTTPLSIQSAQPGGALRLALWLGCSGYGVRRDTSADLGLRQLQLSRDTLVVLTPYTDLSAAQADAALSWGRRGGRLVLATDGGTDAALLESMEERQVTIEGERHDLGVPFFVIATQNPVEYEGTYPLPEAQLDRFLFKITVTYPEVDAERQVLRNYDRGFDARQLDAAGVSPVLSPHHLQAMHDQIGSTTVDDSNLGASPRASIPLLLGSKALAAIRGREYVTQDDV